jgi:signal peptidase II
MDETMMAAGAERGIESTAPAEGAGGFGLYYAVVCGVVALDIVTKLMAQAMLPAYRPIPILGEFFRLTYIYNPGAAFGLHLGENSRFIFLALSAIAVVVLYRMYRTTPREDLLRRVAIATVTGGALGNLIDRIRSVHGVVDFLDFGIPGGARFPVFNVADIAVTIGAILLAISLWTEDHDAARDADA